MLSEHFHFCPRCGAKQSQQKQAPVFQCERCGFVYYFNPAAAVAAIVLGPRDRALFIRRAKEPAQGKLALPGGFVDFGETAEEALRREIREEVNLDVEQLKFLCSQPNQYAYLGVTYPVLDLFFVARAAPTRAVAALDGVASLLWLEPLQVDLEEIAFPSMREALRDYLSRPHSPDAAP